MTMKIIERISQLIKAKGITPHKFEVSIGASNSMVSRAIRNNTDITSEWLVKIISTYPEVSEKWLLTGEGEMMDIDNHDMDKDVDNQTTLEMAIREIDEQRKLVAKAQEQIDRLITLLEKRSE